MPKNKFLDSVREFKITDIQLGKVMLIWPVILQLYIS
jgi:hypothetical protein